MDGALGRFIPKDYEKSFDMWIAGMVVWAFRDISEEEELETFLEVAPMANHDLSCSYSKADSKRRDVDWAEMCNMTFL